MSWIVAVYIPGSTKVLGLRWNGGFSYYTTERDIEVFARRQDAEWALRDEFSIVADRWPKSIVSIDGEAKERFSVGVAVCRAGRKIAERTGYYPPKREVPELIQKAYARFDASVIRRAR